MWYAGGLGERLGFNGIMDIPVESIGGTLYLKHADAILAMEARMEGIGRCRL